MAYPTLEPETLARAFKDGRAYTRHRRFTGKPVHIRIDPPINWPDIAAKAIILFGLGASVALWVTV